MAEGYTCSLCYHFSATGMSAVLRHIGVTHAHQANFKVVCGIHGCPRTYTNYHSFRKHLRRKHMQTLESEPSEIYNDLTMEVDSEELLTESQSSPVWTRKNAALFVLKSREVQQISQLSLNSLLADVSSLVSESIDSFSASICSVLEENGIDLDSISGLNETLSNEEVCAPFHGLESEYLQKKLYQSLGLVEAVERKLGATLKRRNSRSKRLFRLVGEFSYDVPLKDSLQQLLSNTIIFDEVMNGHKRNDGLLEDYCDGSAFKEHPLFSADPTALQIMLYYDDIEVSNPIGSRAKKHKLGNIRPALRSSLKVIQLVTMVKQSFINDYGIDKILEPFMESIQQLESVEGIQLNICGVQHTFRGSISVVCADNLASWNLGGYKALASALRKCRFCMAVSDDMKSKFLSEDFQARTKSTHENHCALLSGPLHGHISTTYGVVRDSILNSSHFFHITDGLAPDIMHDILEGCLQYEVKELLKYYVAERNIISLSKLNNKIEAFPYGLESPNKPTPLSSTSLGSSDHSLKQTATQMWCLARMLPLIIGTCVTENEPHWENFLLMLTITDYSFAPVTSSDISAYLKSLIEEHHSTFCQLYPNAPIIPKHHYMIHLPEWLLRFGPASKYWCMRFEAKHSYFKSLAHKVKCFKNIAKTMSNRHQTLMCYYASSETDYSKDLTFGVVKKTISVSEYQHRQTSDSLCTLGDETDIHLVSWAKSGSMVYKPGLFVVVESSLLPVFGQIQDIVVYGVDNCLFVLQMYSTQCFLHHFHSYEVSMDSTVCACRPVDLVDYHPLNKFTVAGRMVISLKYHLIENI